MQCKRCLRHHATICAVQFLDVFLVFTLTGCLFFKLDWWWTTGRWFRIAGGDGKTVRNCLITSWTCAFLFLMWMITLYWCVSAKASKRELTIYAAICGLFALIDFGATTVILSKSLPNGCDQIWSDFDRVKDSDPEWTLYRKLYLYTDSTPDADALLIYEAWKNHHCQWPAKAIAGFFAVQCIAGAARFIIMALTAATQTHVPLEVTTVETTHLLQEAL